MIYNIRITWRKQLTTMLFLDLYAGINRYIGQYYFETLLNVPIELDIKDKPHLLYNIDENDYQLNVDKAPFMYAKKQ